MSAIVFNNLKSSRSSIRANRSKLYTDLSLDLEVDPNSNNDILVSFDEAAIKNSIFNILNTRKMQNFLDPEFGNSFHRYLFNPISSAIGSALGDDIEELITKYEPRVKVAEARILLTARNNFIF